MKKAIITMIPNVTGLDSPISGAISRPKMTAGTMIKKDTKNFEAKLIECFFPHSPQSIGLYELQIEISSSFHPNFLLQNLQFCKTVPPMNYISLATIISQNDWETSE
jgi:hypothetical protein